MRLFLLSLLALSGLSYGITKEQFEQQQADQGNVLYQRKVKQRRETDANLKREQGASCQSNYNCRLDQFCRRANSYDATGVCVNKSQ